MFSIFYDDESARFRHCISRKSGNMSPFRFLSCAVENNFWGLKNIWDVIYRSAELKVIDQQDTGTREAEESDKHE